MQTCITQLRAREILDSRGKPTVEAELLLADGTRAIASVPSGASTGEAEAVELRDGDARRYDGQGVLRAVEHVNGELARAVKGLDARDQTALDERLIELDGTPNKARLGANAILAASLAAARAAALAQRMELFVWLNRLYAPHLAAAGVSPRLPRMPLPMTNMISGGKHAGGNLDIQDVLIQPVGAPDYPTGLEWIVGVYRRLGELLHQAGFEGYLVGDEGGYGPRLANNRQAIDFVVRAIAAAGLTPGADVNITLDVASSHFYKNDQYHLRAESAALSSEEMIDRLESWIGEFPIASIEDGLAENDWTGWQRLTERLGGRVKLVGDDLFATNAERLARGIREKTGNAVLIKVNQIGTLTETMRTMALAEQAGYRRVISARSGETEDEFLADLAVGVCGDSIKIGSIARSERLAKYNRLLRIGEMV
jgi:enolase